jgi:hypothetical protein
MPGAAVRVRAFDAQPALTRYPRSFLKIRHSPLEQSWLALLRRTAKYPGVTEETESDELLQQIRRHSEVTRVNSGGTTCLVLFARVFACSLRAFDMAMQSFLLRGVRSVRTVTCFSVDTTVLFFARCAARRRGRGAWKGFQDEVLWRRLD